MTIDGRDKGTRTDLLDLGNDNDMVRTAISVNTHVMTAAGSIVYTVKNKH
jgi:hypothetical protein